MIIAKTLEGADISKVERWIKVCGPKYIWLYPIPASKYDWIELLEKGLKMLNNSVSIVNTYECTGDLEIKDPHTFMVLYSSIDPTVKDHLSSIEFFIYRLKNPVEKDSMIWFSGPYSVT